MYFRFEKLWVEKGLRRKLEWLGRSERLQGLLPW